MFGGVETEEEERGEGGYGGPEWEGLEYWVKDFILRWGWRWG